MIELVVNSTRLELRPGEQIILQDSIGRIGNFSEREGQITNDFEILWTGPNIKALGYHDKNTATSTFPYFKQNAFLRQRGVEISKGFVQLVKIDQAGRTATLSFYGTNTNPFVLLGSGSLRDLDLSDLDHDWTKANISASWSNTEGYIYPCVDPGLWAAASYQAADTTVTDWWPAVYQKTLIQRIFEGIGYKIGGPWLQEFSYTNAVIPVARLVESGTANTYSFATNTIPQYKIFEAIPPSPAGGTSSVTLDLNKTNDTTHFDLSNEEYTATTTTAELLNFSAVFDLTTFTVDVPAGTGVYPVTLTTTVKIYQNGTTLIGSDILTQIFLSNQAAPSTINWTKTLTVNVVPSDTVHVELEFDYNSPSSFIAGISMVYQIRDFTIAAPNLIQDAQLAAGDTIDMAYNMPDISQREFILDMVVRHALQVTTDNYTNTVYFTPANKVFSNILNAPNWSNKVNQLTLSTIDFVEIVQDYGQRTNFLYTKDSNDYVQDAYVLAHDEYSGDGFTLIGNEFLDPEVDFYTSVFAATVHRQVFPGDPAPNNPFLPCIPRYDENGDIQDVEPRILFIVRDVDFTDMNGVSNIAIDATSYTQTVYAYFSRNKLNTDLDIYQDGLAWSTPNLAAPADQSLLDRWYRQIIRIWNTPKYVEVEVRLLEYEYQSLDFLTPIYIDTREVSGYFIIDEVESYDGMLATMKLIQIE